MSTTKKIEGTLMRQVLQDMRLLDTLPSEQFEQLVAELLSSFGWDVHVNAKDADGDYDFLAYSKIDPGVQVTWLVECKSASQRRPIGVEDVVNLYGARFDTGVSNAILATTGRFTQGAKEFADSKSDLHLVDHDQITDWLKEIGRRSANADL